MAVLWSGFGPWVKLANACISCFSPASCMLPILITTREAFDDSTRSWQLPMCCGIAGKAPFLFLSKAFRNPHDNAASAQALGCTRVLPFGRVSTKRSRTELHTMLSRPSYDQTAHQLAACVGLEIAQRHLLDRGVNQTIRVHQAVIH